MSCTCSSTATDYAAQLCLGPLVTGDEWDGRTFRIWVRNPSFDTALDRTDTDAAPGTGANPKLVSASTAFTTLSRVLFQVHTSATELDNLVERDSADVGEITIDDATNWIFTIEPYSFTLAAGEYFVAIACLRTSGGWKTFFKGTLTLTGKGIVLP